MAVRWLSLDEFRAGEEHNPYVGEPAAKRTLKAIPESSYNFLLLGSLPYLISVVNGRRKAVPGEVWMPTAIEERFAHRRRVVKVLVVIEVVLLALTALGNDIATLAALAVLLIGLPVMEFASRHVGMRAWIDYRTGEVGVDDGRRRRRRRRRR